MMRSVATALVLILLAWSLASVPARAVEPVVVGEEPAIDLGPAVELRRGAGASLAVQAAADAEGIVNRIEVRSSAQDPSGNWFLFALANPSDEQIDRLVVAQRYRLVGSGLVWPDLGSARIRAITPSAGFSLDRQGDSEADVFRITLDPRSVVTLVGEMEGSDLPSLRLWEPDAYKDAINAYTLYEGIVLGIAGLLAVFLTILFVVKGSAMFPATAALAWAVLAYVSVDFGFVNKLLAGTERDLALWRACAEVFVASSLVIFLYAYLHLNRWNTRYTVLVGLWVLGLLAVFGLAIVSPERAAGIARISIAASAVSGMLVILVLCLRGFDRAVLVAPAWLLLCGWVYAGWTTVTGRLDNDIIQAALGGGLVLIVLLVAFTVMQHAFAGSGAIQSIVSDTERQALALTGAGDAVWDWDVDRDEIRTGHEATSPLGLDPGSLDGSPSNWIGLLHPEDRDRFRAMLDMMIEHRRGRIDEELRLRAHNGQYHWLRLRARPVIGSDGEVLRCVGTMADVTDQRLARERLLRDAVRDGLTGLPNVELLQDRLAAALSLARSEQGPKPTLLLLDFDAFGTLNDRLGLSAGDSLLLTMARRLTRITKPQDTLARLDGDRFALLVLSETDPDRLAGFADAVRRAVALPVTFGGATVRCTASIGLVGYNADSTAPDMLRDGEIAVLRAKREGGNRIEPFRPAFRSTNVARIDLEGEMQGAMGRGEIRLAYQPIVDLKEGRTTGFEALLRWNHPRRGLIAPDEFVPIAERSGLIAELGAHALRNALADLSAWRSGRWTDLFVSVNFSSRQLLRQDLVDEVRSALAEQKLPADALQLELTESLVMDNPEHSAQLLKRLRDLGVRLALDDFGTGYSSLAQLMRFPFHTIKVDRAFVGGADRGRKVILKSILSMARELEMTTIAEGIEEEADAVELRRLGCDMAQGYLYGQPSDASGVRDALRSAKAA